MSELRRFMRANPQVVALLVVCLVLGIGTFLLVIFGLVASGSDTTNGEPSGWRVPPARVVAGTPGVVPRTPGAIPPTPGVVPRTRAAGSANASAVAVMRLVAPAGSQPPPRA
jgi:hypothetical protein